MAESSKIILSNINSSVNLKKTTSSLWEAYVTTNGLSANKKLTSNINPDFYHLKYRNKVSLAKQVYHNSIDDTALQELELEREVSAVLDILRNEDYIEGDITKTQLYLESAQLKNNNNFNKLFQYCWLKLYQGDPQEFRKYICIASCIDYDLINDKADTLILGGASHADPYVNEAALRAAEAWGLKKFSSYIKNMRDFEIKWLQDYKKEVIDYLENKE